MTSRRQTPRTSAVDSPCRYAKQVADPARSIRTQIPHDDAQNDPQGHSPSVRHSEVQNPRRPQKPLVQSEFPEHSFAREVPMHETAAHTTNKAAAMRDAVADRMAIVATIAWPCSLEYHPQGLPLDSSRDSDFTAFCGYFPECMDEMG